MKPLSFTIISLLFLFIPSMAQPQDWNTAGNSIGMGDFLGTTNTMDLE